MKTEITGLHKTRFEEIRKSLICIGSQEGSFVKVELLFFEALTIAREYGDTVEGNDLLTRLSTLKAGAYEKTNEHFKKRSQRELCIRQFISQFKRAISGKASAIA
jgi:hypothetical protein